LNQAKKQKNSNPSINVRAENVFIRRLLGTAKEKADAVNVCLEGE
jgi:hypothetical protein